MIVSATELKSNLGKYLELAVRQDIFITKNGRTITRLNCNHFINFLYLPGFLAIIHFDFNLIYKSGYGFPCSSHSVLL